MSLIYRLAHGFEHHFRIILGASGGGPLWSAESSKPRASYFLWKSKKGDWRAYTGGHHATSPMREIAQGRTRAEAFANALTAQSQSMGAVQ